MGVDLSQFHATFFEESFEGLDVMEAELIELDHEAELDAEQINTIFRAAHSIKGGSGTFGFEKISAYTHTLETLLDKIRSDEISIDQVIINALLESVDCVREMLHAEKEHSAHNEQLIAETARKMEAILSGEVAAAVNEISQRNLVKQEQQTSGWKIHFAPEAHILRTGNDPLRILRELASLGEMAVTANTEQIPEFNELDPESCFLVWDIVLSGNIEKAQITEVFEWVLDDCQLDITPLNSSQQQTVNTDELTNDTAAEQATQILQETLLATDKQDQVERDAGNPDVSASERIPVKKQKKSTDNSSIRVGTDKVDELINLVGELVITQSMLCEVGRDFDYSKMDRLMAGLAQLERHTRELQDSALRIRMLPISFTFNRFPRLVHDLSNKLGKKIELMMSGENTELDKTVMEKISDPLVHLVRNSIDHGLESPELRKAAGKDETGTLHLNAYHKGGNIIIEIADDGAGLDKQKIIARAVEKGLVQEGEDISDDRIHELIFEPGFSTAEQVSDVSGRGVGMDVVRKNIRELGGAVDVASVPGQGSTISIRLPLTLAIMDGQLVRVGKEIFVIPMVSIIETLEAKSDNIKKIFDSVEVYDLRSEYISILRMNEVFNIQPDQDQISDGLLVVLEGELTRIGVCVDELLGQQQVVIKSLEANYKRIDGISGATILGDGTVAMILDVAGLVMLSRSKKIEATENRVA